MISEEIIRLEQISKSYHHHKILNAVDLTIHRGDSIALTGHNGSGKSTILKIIAKLTNIDSGKVIHNGSLKINYIPERFPKMNLTARQYITYMGQIEQIPHAELKQKTEQLFQKFYLADMADIPMKHLSKGSLQKTGVIQAFLTKPDVLLLDEPLSGQDIDSQQRFIQMVRELISRGVAVVMSCHEMYLVNQLSKSAYCIENQQLVSVDLDHFANTELDILCFESHNGRKIPERLQNRIEAIEYNEQRIQLIIKRSNSNQVLQELLKEGYILRSMKGVVQ